MLGDRIASKSGVQAVVKTADGEEVLVRDALILDQKKTPHWAGLVRFVWRLITIEQ